MTKPSTSSVHDCASDKPVFFSLDQFDLLEIIGAAISLRRLQRIRNSLLTHRNRKFCACPFGARQTRWSLLCTQNPAQGSNAEAQASRARPQRTRRAARPEQSTHHQLVFWNYWRLLRSSGSCRAGTFQDSRHLYMLLEYVPGGELFFHLRRAGRFPISTVRFYVASLTLILEFLHANDVVYRDLKPENVMLDQNGYARLTDFGFAKKVRERTWTLCGTPEYLAPEVIQSRGHGTAVDFWSLGVLFYELIQGHPPFSDDNPFVIYQQILDGRVTYPKAMDPWAKDLIRRLLNGDQSKRIGNLYHGVEDIKQHRFFKGFDWAALANGTLRAPIVPKIKSPGDTSHFDDYPDIASEPDEPDNNEEADDVFQGF